MGTFNELVDKILESNTVGGVMGISSGPYAPGDNRPITPAQIALGAKTVKNKKNSKRRVTKIPIQRRPRIETMI